jgi:pyruvate dehydrogenase E2 component (dihydrolipoamide acetyltransferase)
VELPIPFTGTVHELRFEEGTTVDVGTPIISVDTGGTPGAETAEAPAGVAAAESAAETAAAEDQADAGSHGEGRQPVLVGYGVSKSSTKRRPRKPSAGAGTPADANGAQGPAAAGQGGATQPGASGAAAPAAPASASDSQAVQPTSGPELNGHSATAAPRPLAKPPVRKLAKDLGVDLASVTPTGDGGIVTRDDVMAAAAPAEPETAAEAAAEPVMEPAAPAEAPPAPYGREGETRVPIRGVRKATAQAMVSSAFTAPHVTEFVTVDVTRTMKLVQELKQDPDMEGLRVNPMLLVAKAFLVAIRRHPEVNAAWDEANQEIVRKDYVNLGIAAATPRGLIVPNIKGAQAKTLPELASALGELVSTAREGRTSPAAMQGGTVTITNVGVFGIDTGTPILNPGESAILAFGQVREQPWVHKGKVKPRQVTTLALSFDHRLVDGELGSRVLADVAAVLERPKRLMTWT